jgi:hypothetical protein
MGFYYGSSQPPEDEPGGFKETLLIIWAVFQALALPLGILFGGMLVLVVLFVLFAAHPLAGLSGLLAIVAAVVGYGAWEAKHPPEIK